MCGITGMFSYHRNVQREALQKSVQALHHRGPDCAKIWISKDHHAGLGHARLSIIDLKTGDQPLTNKAKNIHLVVNGEFYGFEQQRKELEQKGHHLLTHTDSEIAIHLYEDYGTYCLSKLRGEFAFILWDERNQLCFAARDRFGIKPLFYTVYNDMLYLASEVKALFAAGVPAAWDTDAMNVFVNSTLHLTYQTPYRGIYQIPPGHYLLAMQHHLQLYKYWDINYPEISDHPILSAEEYISQMQALLEESVRIRLRADVPVACYLSGGLDSSAVLGMAQKHSPKPISAFTLSFDKKEYDEYQIAREMAEKSGANFQPVNIKQSDLAQHFVDAVVHGETFLYNGHSIAKFVLSKAVRDAGFKVVLTGEGADELFAGYPHFRLDQLRYGSNHLDKAQKQALLAKLLQNNVISSGLLMPEIDTKGIESVNKVLGFTPAWFMAAFQSGVKMSEIMSDDLKTNVANYDVFKIILNSLDVDNQMHNRHPVNQSLYLWSKFRLPTYILTVLGDRMEMAHSIEGRLPLLDHRVAEFMRNVPVDLKIHGMTEKYLLREAAKSVITKTVYERQKHPFLAPPAALDPKQPFYELLQTTLRGPSLQALPFFNQQKVIKLLDRLPQMTLKECVTWDMVLMIVLSACILQEKFKLTADALNFSDVASGEIF